MFLTFALTGCGDENFEISDIPPSGLVLTIGNYPLTPPRYELCSNIIRISDDHRLRVTIENLDPNCFRKYSSDWLEMFGSNLSTPLFRKRLCEETTLKPLTSISNELLIRFESHTHGSRKGFKLTIEKGIIF